MRHGSRPVASPPFLFRGMAAPRTTCRHGTAYDGLLLFRFLGGYVFPFGGFRPEGVGMFTVAISVFPNRIGVFPHRIAAFAFDLIGGRFDSFRFGFVGFRCGFFVAFFRLQVRGFSRCPRSGRFVNGAFLFCPCVSFCFRAFGSFPLLAGFFRFRFGLRFLFVPSGFRPFVDFALIFRPAHFDTEPGLTVLVASQNVAAEVEALQDRNAPRDGRDHREDHDRGADGEAFASRIATTLARFVAVGVSSRRVASIVSVRQR
jgi:hypothetical protein